VHATGGIKAILFTENRKNIKEKSPGKPGDHIMDGLVSTGK
jgi:hypothetical protein